MKLYREGTIDLKRVAIRIVSLLIASLSFWQVNAQIPINGFCRYESFALKEGLKNFTALSFNADAYTDLALFDPSKKELITYSGQAEGAFKLVKTNHLSDEISSLEPIDKNLPGTTCAFISRKKRKTGLLNISPYGTAYILSELKLNSYPGGMSLYDIDSDGFQEILLYGEAFNGLSLITRKNGRLKEKKLLSKNVYSHALWTDLNHDTYPDIIAVDLMTNSLKFFFNNSRGEFYEARELKAKEKITSILTYDFDLDGFQDIIVVQGKNIHILFGDNVSSFARTETVTLDFEPEKVVISDFNRDGLNDIAYMDKSHSLMSVAFSKDDGTFFREINYLYKKDLSEVAPYYSKFLTGILSLDSKGNLYLISNLNVIKDNVSLSMGAEPKYISYFDAGNNRIIDLCSLDKFRPVLNIMLRDKGGIPSHFYSVDLVDTCNRIEISDRKAYEKTFYCYSKGKRLIQAITVNFRDNHVSKNNFYAAGAISDLKIVSGEGQERDRLYAALINNGILKLEAFEYNNYKYTSITSGGLETDALDASIDEYDPLSVFYWKKGSDYFYFKKLTLNKEFSQQNYINAFTVKPLKSFPQPWITGDIFNQDKSSAANFIIDTDNYYAFISSINKNKKFRLKGSYSAFSVLNSSMLSIGEVRFNGLKKLLVYNNADKALEKLDVLNNSGILLSTKLAQADNVGSYFVKNMNFKKYHFVYTDKAEKCVTIKELP